MSHRYYGLITSSILLFVIPAIACIPIDDNKITDLNNSSSNTDVNHFDASNGSLNDQIIGDSVSVIKDNSDLKPSNELFNVPEYMKDVWMCTKDSALTFDDLTTDAEEQHQCSVNVEYTDEFAILSANGIPNHDFESGLGCCADEVNYQWKIPLYPKMSSIIEYAPDRGPVAVSVNGVPFFGPEEGPGGDAVAMHFDYFEEDRQPIVLGLCGGHSGPGDAFHYHYDANCVHWHPENENKSWADWTIDFLNVDEPSPVIGFAFDGYPIYGPFGYGQDDEFKQMLSSYQLKEGKNGYDGIDDWEYVEGLGDLDECNGIHSRIPSMNEPVYHYHASKNSGSGEIGFPYFLLCYSGIVEETNFAQGSLIGGPFPQEGAPPSNNNNGNNNPPPGRRPR